MQITHSGGEQEIEKGLERMKRTLDHEINRLTALQKNNKDTRSDESRQQLKNEIPYPPLFKKQEYDWMRCS